jgi:hypothetical protein
MRRKREKDPLELILPLAGLVAVGFVFSPVLKAAIVGLVYLAAAIFILLIGWAIFRHYRNKLESEHVETYLGITGISASTEIDPEDDESDQTGTTFSQELLDALEWRRFEELVTWYFEKTGFQARRSRVGADGGVDIHLFRMGDDRPFAYVQCKAWYTYTVGVKPVRELFGVMAADGIGTGYFVATGGFTEEARMFADGKGLKLVSGIHLLEKLESLSDLDRSEILRKVTSGDYTTPTCPRCDEKMVSRTGNAGDFWGCRNYSRRPSCRQTFKLRSAGATG